MATLDLEASAFDQCDGRTVDPGLFADRLRPRVANSHKGNFGNAGILGGTRSMVGAALLAARAALRLGSGRVYVGLLDDYAPALDIQQPELMMRSPGKLLATDLTALACGPGMGTSHEAGVILDGVFNLKVPLVLDADALNLVAGEGDLHVVLATRKSPTLLTPHPAEAARLLDCGIAQIQADRVGAARELSSTYNAHVVLKGCGTIIAAPDGDWFVNTSGNPGLATAGSGDVLTGLVVALLAQDWPPLEALLAGVHLHGCAADALVAQGCGPVGLTAGELIDPARACFNQWIAERR
ncbi:MAG: NAD(P)H-hydrate dehydratase [Propionivibrio sp.]